MEKCFWPGNSYVFKLLIEGASFEDHTGNGRSLRVEENAQEDTV